MQLQLLKLESNAYDEGSSLISSDEDEAPTESVVAAKGPTHAECDNWEASYTADVLAELDLEDNDPNMLMATWNASDSTKPQPWVRTRLACGFGPQLSKARLEFELRKLLSENATIEEESETTTMAKAALQSDSQWMDLGMHIDGIGRELGKMVLDDLIVESLAIENEY